MRGAARVHPAWLTGTWEGTAYQVIASKDAAQEVDVRVTFAEGGAWKAMNGASGASWLTGNQVVLDGAFSGGSRIRYTLKERRNADGTHELWGVGEATFGALREPEEDPLKRRRRGAARPLGVSPSGR